jgi:uncharacterized zinc-type alcohol dehydrogenase-like protein
MLASTSYGATRADAPLAKLAFERRDPRPEDVRIEVLHCGVCHSDEWGNMASLQAQAA